MTAMVNWPERVDSVTKRDELQRSAAPDPPKRGRRLESDQDAGRPDLRVRHARELVPWRRLSQGHLPLVQIASISRALQ